MASATKQISRANADGPCLNSGGGLYCMVGPSGKHAQRGAAVHEWCQSGATKWRDKRRDA
ncbi:hypothetical protein THI4931_37060 [Pandoraea sputorum]|nr:hypothetical protein THI4931_37060 [Pandoraea sputorum]